MPLALDTPQTYPTYTNKAIDEGIFDQLMAAAKSHINEEYTKGRIQADVYGQVYLGMLEAVLTNSTQYLLGLLLIDEKRRGQDLANQKAEYELEVLLPLQAELTQKQIDKIVAEISLMQKQEEKIDKEIEFLDAKIQTELANTQEGIADPGSLIGKQISLLTAQRMGFAGDIYTKVGKLWADYDAIFQSVQEIETGINLSLPTQAELSNAKDIASAINALT
jgi:hypothetical protein